MFDFVASAPTDRVVVLAYSRFYQFLLSRIAAEAVLGSYSRRVGSNRNQ